jgi:ATP-dependent Lon protease
MSSTPSKEPLRILVVDDESEVRNLLLSMLRREGHEVLEAGNGRDAMRILAGTEVDVVLTDLVMPEMEGLEFIRSLLKESPSSRVIAMSGVAAGSTYLEAAQRFGVIATLEKPFRREQLLEVIEAAR